MVIATVYMRVLLPESMADEIRRNTKLEEDVSISLLNEDGNSRTNQVRVFKTMPSFGDSVSLLRSRLVTLSSSLLNRRREIELRSRSFEDGSFFALCLTGHILDITFDYLYCETAFPAVKCNNW